MEDFKSQNERSGEPDCYNELEWDAPNRERQTSLFYADFTKTCDELKDRAEFGGVFCRLTEEFAAVHHHGD
jgi:hypothetical protein